MVISVDLEHVNEVPVSEMLHFERKCPALSPPTTRVSLLLTAMHPNLTPSKVSSAQH